MVVTSSGGVIQRKVFPPYKLLVIRMEIRRSGDLVEFQIFEQHLSPALQIYASTTASTARTSQVVSCSDYDGLYDWLDIWCVDGVVEWRVPPRWKSEIVMQGGWNFGWWGIWRINRLGRSGVQRVEIELKVLLCLATDLLEGGINWRENDGVVGWWSCVDKVTEFGEFYDSGEIEGVRDDGCELNGMHWYVWRLTY